ncbi:hypothetical protein AB205_0092470, partial [Aquarana catesbeiana]
MAEEADVDIEGDGAAECSQRKYEELSSGFVPDHYLDSVWKSNDDLTPWTLDSTISDENRAVIERMLLEEEIRSPSKPSSGAVKWTVEEKDLFEQGLAKFGRRWTNIARLIGSRTVLQVKSYARQYFKNK